MKIEDILEKAKELIGKEEKEEKEYKVNIDFWNPPEEEKHRLPYLERVE